MDKTWTNDQLRMKLITYGYGFKNTIKINQSRNKREGRFYGRIYNKFVRCDRLYRNKFYVSSWYAFLVVVSRGRMNIDV